MLWLNVVQHIPKNQRYTIGVRIENTFLDLLQGTYIAYYTDKERKAAKVADCILLLDTVKFLLQIAWEAKLVSHTQYATLAEKLNEVGKMFGGWKKSLGNPEKKSRSL